MAALPGLFVVGCSSPEDQLGQAVKTEYGGLIVEVRIDHGNWLDPASLTFIVEPGTDRATVRHLACVDVQRIAEPLHLSRSIYVTAQTFDGSYSTGGTTHGCEPES